MSFDRLRSGVHRLSVRLTLWHSFLFLASALVMLALTYVLLRNRARATERDTIEFRLNQYLSEYQNGGVEAVRRLASLRKGRAQKAFFVRVADANNRATFRRDADDWAEFQPAQLSGQPLPPSGQRVWQVLRAPGDVELLLVAERLPDGGLLQVGKSNEELLAVLDEYCRSAVLVLLVFVPASFAGGSFLALRALRPVKHLTGAAEEIVATSRFDARVPAPGSGDELDALVRVFNRMLERIDALVRGMRESIDNVAHDLRTPITRLRHKAQSAIEWSDEHPEATECARCRPTQEALADCVEEADRVVTMLNTLMDIAETEAGLAKLEPVLLSASEICARAVESYTEYAEERGVAVTSEVPPHLWFRGDEIAISRVFSNLLDNAIKYTPSGGRVRITAERDGDAVKVRFADTGVGVSEEDLPRIWDRLFRGDRSRSERGLGLGLSFVRTIVQAHGGSSSAESRRGEGTVITVSLPQG